MKKFITALVLLAPIYLLNGCVATHSAYDPGYSNDYVYSVGYYNNRPYWGNNYYHYGYAIGNYGYWGGLGVYESY